MSKTYKVNQDKCLGCGVCVASCPGGSELEEDGKAKIVDSEKVENCGGKDICPYGAIEEVK